jgi:hypothetical protein
MLALHFRSYVVADGVGCGGSLGLGGDCEKSDDNDKERTREILAHFRDDPQLRRRV